MTSTIFTFLRKKIITILLFSVSFSIIFILFSFLFQAKFKTELYGFSTLHDVSYYKSNVQIINNLIAKNDKNLLAKALNVDIALAEDLLEIEYFSLVSKRKLNFKIELIAKSNNHFNEYKEGLVYFFENYGLNKQNFQAEKSKIEDLISFKKNEIDLIETMIQSKEKYEIDSDLFIGKNTLYTELENLKVDYLNIHGLNFINKPLKPLNPFFPKKYIFGVMGFIIGFVFSFAFYLLQFEFLNKTDVSTS